MTLIEAAKELVEAIRNDDKLHGGLLSRSTIIKADALRRAIHAAEAEAKK